MKLKLILRKVIPEIRKNGPLSPKSRSPNTAAGCGLMWRVWPMAGKENHVTSPTVSK